MAGALPHVVAGERSCWAIPGLPAMAGIHTTCEILIAIVPRCAIVCAHIVEQCHTARRVHHAEGEIVRDTRRQLERLRAGGRSPSAGSGAVPAGMPLARAGSTAGMNRGKYRTEDDGDLQICTHTHHKPLARIRWQPQRHGLDYAAKESVLAGIWWPNLCPPPRSAAIGPRTLTPLLPETIFVSLHHRTSLPDSYIISLVSENSHHLTRRCPAVARRAARRRHSPAGPPPATARRTHRDGVSGGG